MPPNSSRYRDWECVGCGRRHPATTQARECEDRHERGQDPEDD